MPALSEGVCIAATRPFIPDGDTLILSTSLTIVVVKMGQLQNEWILFVFFRWFDITQWLRRRGSLEYIPCHRRSCFGYERFEYEHSVSVMIRASSLRSYSGTLRLLQCYGPYRKQSKRIAVRNLSAYCATAPCSGGLHSRLSSLYGTSRESKSMKVSGCRPRLSCILTLSIEA